MLQHKKFVKKTKKNKIVQVTTSSVAVLVCSQSIAHLHHCVAAVGEQGALSP